MPGFAGRKQVLARYAESSGRDLSDVAFYMAFGYWKLACILQGVYARYVAGAGAGDPQRRLVPRQPSTDWPGGRPIPWRPDDDGRPYEVNAERTLDNPVMVVALEGWVDAGLGAATAITALLAGPPTSWSPSMAT